MPDFTEALSALRRLPTTIVVGGLALLIALVSCTGSDIGPRRLGFELIQAR